MVQLSVQDVTRESKVSIVCVRDGREACAVGQGSHGSKAPL